MVKASKPMASMRGGAARTGIAASEAAMARKERLVVCMMGKD
jgi:hypothetical protein